MPPLPPIAVSERPALRRVAWRAVLTLGAAVAATLGPVLLALLLSA